MARPIRPLPSSKGWMHSKYRLAIPALVKAGSASFWPGSVRLNQVMNRAISDGTRDDGGASKCTLGSCIAWETTCMGSAPVRYRPTSFKSRLPLITMRCQRNSISPESGSANDRYRSTVISARPLHRRLQSEPPFPYYELLHSHAPLLHIHLYRHTDLQLPHRRLHYLL